MKIWHTLGLMSMLLSIQLSQVTTYQFPNLRLLSGERSTIVLDENRRFLAIGLGRTWVWNRTDESIEEIDLATGLSTGKQIALDFEPLIAGAGVEAGSLWVLSDDR